MSEPAWLPVIGSDGDGAVRAGSGRSRRPRGSLARIAASRAPTRAAWRMRADSLTSRWLKAGRTVGSVTALTRITITTTTSSSIRVKPPPRGDRGIFMLLNPPTGRRQVVVGDVIEPRLGQRVAGH